MRHFKVLDLFAGGGGFSTGFMMAKHPHASFEIVKAVEINEDACKTLEKHLGPDKVLLANLTEQEVKESLIKECREKKVDVIIGGPPCQTFSLAGPARSGTKEMREALKDDDRNTLYKDFLDIVRDVNPEYVVFENVEGILSKKVEVSSSELSKQERLAIELVCDDLEEIGYSSFLQENPEQRYMILNSAYYGVPQQRRRVIIIANKHGRLNPSPRKTHGVEAGLKPFVTIGDAIGQVPLVLPKIHHSKARKLKNMGFVLANLSESIDLFAKTLDDLVENYSGDTDTLRYIEIKELADYVREFRASIGNDVEDPEKLLCDFIEGYNSKLKSLTASSEVPTTFTSHSSRAHNFRDIVIFCKMKRGTNSSQFMNKQMEVYDEFLDTLYPYDKNKHKDTYVKHSWTKPSNTILSHMEKDGLKFIHPNQPRSFTPYEAALLQSFPARYEFCGGRNSQYRQIGNAVPPKMAAKIAESLLEVLVQHDLTTKAVCT